MQLIILPGKNRENKTWANELARKLNSNFEKIRIHEYVYWTNPDTARDFNFNEESVFFTETTQSDKNFVVIAKSIGTLLVLSAIYRNKIKPNNCVFIGTAINWARGNNYPIEDWLRNFTIPSIFIQNESDYAMPAPELKNLLEELNVTNCIVIPLAGEKHEYKDTGQIAQHIKEFFKMHQ